MQEVIVEDYELSPIPKGSWSPNSGVFQIQDIKSEKDIKVPENKKIIISPLILVIATGCSMPGYQFISGAGTISEVSDYVFPSPQGIFSCFKKFARGSCNGSFQQTSPPYPSLPCACDFILTDAGQDKILVN